MAVDGSFFAVAPRILWALFNQSEATGTRKGQVRLHINFDVLKGIPAPVCANHEPYQSTTLPIY